MTCSPRILFPQVHTNESHVVSGVLPQCAAGSRRTRLLIVNVSVLTTRNLTVGWLVVAWWLELNWCSPIQRCGCMPSSSCQRRKCPNVACDSVCASSDAHHHKRAVLPTARLSKCQNDDRPATRIIIVSCVSFNDMMSECGLVRCVLKNEFSQRPVTLTMISVQLKIQNVTY